MWSRRLLEASAGADIKSNACSDFTIEKKLKKNTPPESYLLERNPAPEDTYYLYRWGGIGTHLSGYTGDDETKLERAQFAITHSEYYRTGRIVLEPEYRMDYEKACRQFLDTFEEG